MPVKDNMKRIMITLDDEVVNDLFSICSKLNINYSKCVALLIEFVCWRYDFGRHKSIFNVPSPYIREFNNFVEDHSVLEGSSITFKNFD